MAFDDLTGGGHFKPRKKTAQQVATLAQPITRAEVDSAVKTAVELALAKVSAPAPAVPAKIPQLARIVYVFENGNVVLGTPTSLEIVQEGGDIRLINVASKEGDKYTYSDVATFKGCTIVKNDGGPGTTPVGAKQQ